ncbi:MAG: alginate lyase family protein [Phycisphaeraceae bacterium]|nr:MAG: alginate lyase family protein [Phycisphaeraceae bacterium]
MAFGRHRLCLLAPLLAAAAFAHPLEFGQQPTYADMPPAAGAEDIANWIGAPYDAANVGGSGVNADGGADNGVANDGLTYVRQGGSICGQTFTTGANPDGYRLDSITVRVAEYPDNIASIANGTAWSLDFTNGPVIVGISKVNGTTLARQSQQWFSWGGIDNPGSGQAVNGPGSAITFTLPYTTYLDPDTEYAFDFFAGRDSQSEFEWDGTIADHYAGGTAYTRSGTTLTPLDGDRAFSLDLTALNAPRPAFSHPGTLHTQADIDRMHDKIVAHELPWYESYVILRNSPYASLGWPANPQQFINRGGADPNNYTRSQQDAQAIYELVLRWQVTGSTPYADHAVEIANAWAYTLEGVTGDSNASLAAGICGYLFAEAGDLLSTYPGWDPADKRAYQDMLMRAFYPANIDFLWRHHGTPWSTGGNTHYRLNWDCFNMEALAAIGVMCDNQAVYEQAIDYFKTGPGNGRIERAAWYIHPDGLAQTEEVGRDQGHNMTGWHSMTRLCQIAWNNGDDLFAYDNNRVLRAVEYITKYNLWVDPPFVFHRNCDLTYTESLATGGRGALPPMFELIYNHYVNVKGLAAPYAQTAAEIVRPEPWPDTAIHPSQVDWLGLGTLTFTLDPIAEGAPPSGLRAVRDASGVDLHWWGSAYATAYNVKRADRAGGPYDTIASVDAVNGSETHFTDADVPFGSARFYKVSAETTGGETTDSEVFEVSRRMTAHYAFEGDATDSAGGHDATLHGGSTGAPAFVAGHGIGQAISLDGIDDYVQLPKNIAQQRDLTIAAWVNWHGGSVWQRIFDFGTEIEKYMYLTPSEGSSMRFQMTTSRNTDGSGTVNAPKLATDEWTHIAITIGGDTVTIYQNGAAVASNTIDGVEPLFGQPFCYIGRSMWNNDPLFNGVIDDFRIYNYALAPAAIGQIMPSQPNIVGFILGLQNGDPGADVTGDGVLDMFDLIEALRLWDE